MHREPISMTNGALLKNDKRWQFIATALRIEEKSTVRTFAFFYFKTPTAQKLSESRQNGIEVRQIIGNARSHSSKIIKIAPGEKTLTPNTPRHLRKIGIAS